MAPQRFHKNYEKLVWSHPLPKVTKLMYAWKHNSSWYNVTLLFRRKIWITQLPPGISSNKQKYNCHPHWSLLRLPWDEILWLPSILNWVIVKATLEPGGHWPRKGVCGCGALKTPGRFTPLLSLEESHFKQKSQFTRPLLRNFGNFNLYSRNFCQNFSSQAPKFGNFQLTSPQFWKFSVHKPQNFEIFSSQAPSFRGKYQFASPTLRKSGPHTPTWKKIECRPPGPGTGTELAQTKPNNTHDKWVVPLTFHVTRPDNK